jgi:hypothetical protein
LAVVAFVACSAAPLRAETLPIIEGLPGTYTPGQAFSFDVRVPQLPDLSSYTVELLFTGSLASPIQSAGATPPAPPPTGRYVFTSNAGFVPDFSASEGRLTLSDSGFTPVTLQNVNDTIAHVTVTPDANLTGDLVISLGPNSNFQYNPEGPFYDAPQPIRVEMATPAGPAVPAPPGVVLFAVGGLALAARARFVRRAA